VINTSEISTSNLTVHSDAVIKGHLTVEGLNSVQVNGALSVNGETT